MNEKRFYPSQTHMKAKLMFESGFDIYTIAKNLQISSQVARALLRYWGYS